MAFGICFPCEHISLCAVISSLVVASSRRPPSQHSRVLSWTLHNWAVSFLWANQPGSLFCKSSESVVENIEFCCQSTCSVLEFGKPGRIFKMLVSWEWCLHLSRITLIVGVPLTQSDLTSWCLISQKSLQGLVTSSDTISKYEGLGLQPKRCVLPVNDVII